MLHHSQETEWEGETHRGKFFSLLGVPFMGDRVIRLLWTNLARGVRVGVRVVVGVAT